MMPSARRAFFVGLLLFYPSAAPTAQRPPAPEPKPRLVVVIGVDQFRTDYIDKFEGQWTKGLRRLLDEGAWFSEAAYPYARTVTCAGHATVATGTLPWKHGVINNAWWDREAGEQLSCTADPSAPAVAYGAHAATSGESARRLLMPTLADELRAQSGHPAKVVTLSMKARSAIMLAGQRADLVAWHQGADGWMSSSAHGVPGRVPFLERYVTAHPVDQELSQTWDRALPRSSYLYEDDGAGEAPPHDGSTTFPHSLKAETREASYGRWESSPLADAYLGRMATAALESFGLGKGPGTDFLGVGFSGLDRVGHAFGPRSHEVQDTLIRLDATLAELFDALDTLVGRDHYVVALTADHGVSPVPEQMTARGLDAGRLQMKAVVKQAEAALAKVLGPGEWVEHVVSGELYLTPEARERLDQTPHAWEEVVAAIQQVPGVGRVFRTDAVLRGEYADDPLARLVRRSLYAGRNGEINLVPKPYWIISGTGATHGSANAYDRRVPVLLMGPAVAPGRYFGAASPADVAPTLALLAGVTLADPDGRALTEALQPLARTPGRRNHSTSTPAPPGPPVEQRGPRSR
jgi:predicted AlkP superfamily pyrophosphatase or phosphodiesterase